MQIHWFLDSFVMQQQAGIRIGKKKKKAKGDAWKLHNEVVSLLY